MSTSRPNPVFALVTGPSRKGWPIHGAFSLGNDDESQPVFSVATAREIIKLLVEKEIIDGDQAGVLLQEVADSDLPTGETRWDKIVALFTDPTLAARLIGVLSGAAAPEEGSGPARFEVCQQGHLCGHEHCDQHPPHGQIFLADVNTPLIGLMFSIERVKAILAAGVKDGLFEQDEADQVLDEAGRSGIAVEAGRYDALADSMRDGLSTMLDIVSGVTPITHAAEFMACGRAEKPHVHLVGTNRVVFSGKLYSNTDARDLIERDLKAGFIDETDAARLREQLPTFGLPEVTPPQFQLKAVFREAVELLFDGDVPTGFREAIDNM